MIGFSWRQTALKPCTPAGVRGAQSSGLGACFYMLFVWLRPPAGPPFSCFVACCVLRAQSSVHRTCATAIFCGRQVTFFLSSSGLSATCCHGCFCHLLYRDEAWTRTIPLRSLLLHRRSPPTFHGARHSFRFQLPCCRWRPAFSILAPGSLGFDGGRVGAKQILLASLGGTRR